MMITYGHRVTSDDDEFVQLSEELAQTSMHFPGSQIVDILPIRTWALSHSDYLIHPTHLLLLFQSNILHHGFPDRNLRKRHPTFAA